MCAETISGRIRAVDAHKYSVVARREVRRRVLLGSALGDDVDVVIREWSPLWGRSGAFAEGPGHPRQSR